MKKLFTMMALIVCAVAVMGQKPVITFEKTQHDFGKINEADGRVTTVFSFKNEGMEPLVLSNVRASCGCTTPKWTREPVEPGQEGQITVTYNPNGRPGRFQKTITVTSNATEATKRLYIKGEVIPKPAKPVNAYPIQMGELSLKSKSAYFGVVKKGQVGVQEIEYANKTDHDITVELALPTKDLYIDGQATLKTLKPNETGKFILHLVTMDNDIYGPVESAVEVVVNGKAEHSDEYRINLKGEVEEDFSNLSLEQRQQAPIAEIEEPAETWSVGSGATIKKQIKIQNMGATPLMIRRVYSHDDAIKVVAPKSIKPGKKGAIKVEYKAMEGGKVLEKGDYKRQIVVLTNDPKEPKRTINLRYNVQ